LATENLKTQMISALFIQSNLTNFPKKSGRILAIENLDKHMIQALLKYIEIGSQFFLKFGLNLAIENLDKHMIQAL
jgi:hypothetical protein